MICHFDPTDNPTVPEKACSKCGGVKPINAFYTKNGKPRAACKKCFSAAHLENYYKDETKSRAKTNAYHKSRPESGMLYAAKCRAIKKGIPFNLTRADIIVPDVCPVLGAPMSAGGNKVAGINSPSLDRLIPELGYVRGNVIVVSWLANAIRNTATPEQILTVGHFYARLFHQ